MLSRLRRYALLFQAHSTYELFNKCHSKLLGVLLKMIHFHPRFCKGKLRPTNSESLNNTSIIEIFLWVHFKTLLAFYLNVSWTSVKIFSFVLVFSVVHFLLARVDFLTKVNHFKWEQIVQPLEGFCQAQIKSTGSMNEVYQRNKHSIILMGVYCLWIHLAHRTGTSYLILYLRKVPQVAIRHALSMQSLVYVFWSLPLEMYRRPIR